MAESRGRRFVALARVSSREPEREGFSLDVQVDALQQYAERVAPCILWRVSANGGALREAPPALDRSDHFESAVS